MSCITQILKKTGNKPYMIDPLRRGDGLIVEGGGEYRGYEFLITFTDLGHRCGYVAVPPTHPLNDMGSRTNAYTKKDVLDYDEADIDCHGGLTFADRNHRAKDLLEVHCDDIWLGFDCAHGGDGKDIPKLKEYFGENCQTLKFYDDYPQYLNRRDDFEVVRDFDYVVANCHKIIDQLIEREAA